MIKEEGPISSYLEKKGLKGKQIFQNWKDSPIRQDLKDIQTGVIDQAKGGYEHAKDFASKAAETTRQVASGEATKRVVTVTGPGPTDYKVDIPSNKKTNNETGTTPTPPKTETPKTETPPAGSAAAKMSFVDAYNKARQMAKDAGKDENLAQFRFDRGGGEKVYQAAATKADYVPMSKQFKVDINTPTTKTSDVTPKSVKTTSVQNPVSGPDISSKPGEGTKYPADATGVTPSPARDVSGSEGAKYPASGGVRQSTGTFEKGDGYATIREPKTESGGKKKMSEEHISEAPYGAPGLVGTGNMNRTGGGTITTAPRPTPRPTNLSSSSTTSAKPAKPMMGTASDFANFKQHNQGATYGQYLNTIRGLTAKKGGANDPDVIRKTNEPKDLKTWDPNKTSTTQGAPMPRRMSSDNPNVAPSQGSTANLNAPGRGPSDRTPAILQDRGSDPKTSSTPSDSRVYNSGIGVQGGSTQSGVRSAYEFAGAGRSGSPDIATSKDRDIEREVAGGDPTPKGGYQMDQPRPPRSTEAQPESGGKKKKMSEENNPLIAMFLKLQEKNTLTPNIFEAAKKAKKDHDGDGNIESEKDEVWGSRFRAARAAGKMEEENLDELKKPTPETAAKVVDRADNRDEWSPKAANRLYSAYKKRYEPKPEAKAGKMEEESAYKGKNPFDPKDPSVQRGSSEVTSSPAKPAEPVHVKPSNPEKLKNLKDPRDPSVQGSGDVTYNEEVYFSETELAHLASVMEAEPVSKTPRDYSDNTGYRTTAAGGNITDGTIAEGRPRKNPTPETTERDARQHIQVQAGRAAGGTVVDFKHDNGKISKLTPGMGRAITAHLNGLKPAERQEAVKRMHASPEGLKV